jgi:hypothetical protein
MFGAGVRVEVVAVGAEVDYARGVVVVVDVGVDADIAVDAEVEAYMWKLLGLEERGLFLQNLDAAVAFFGLPLPHGRLLVATMDCRFLSLEPSSHTRFGSSELFARSKKRCPFACCPPLPGLPKRQYASSGAGICYQYLVAAVVLAFGAQRWGLC